MSGLIAAVRLLTVVPIAGDVGADARSIARSPVFFPLVGAGIGLALGGLDRGLTYVVPGAVAAAVVVAAGIALTGALHLDGLADTVDGLFGGRTPGRRLEIMRDSAIGTFGVAAVGSSLLIRWACIAALASPARFPAIVVALMLGRWAALLLVALFPYAREQGLGSGYDGWARLRLPVGGAAAAAGSYLLMGPWGLVLAGVATVSSLAVGRFAADRLGGGLTGDVYGAASEVGETVALLGAVVLVTRGIAAVPLWV